MKLQLALKMKASSLQVVWQKHSSLSAKLHELLKDQYDFIDNNRNVKCLPHDLNVSYDFYAINGTRAFKLILL